MTTPSPDEITLSDELCRHAPIYNIEMGSIVGCSCMDRVFYRRHESYPEHIAETIVARFAFPAPVVTEEMVEAAAKELARLDLPDSHTLDDRLLAVERWRRYEYEARRVLSAALTPEAGQ